MKDDTDKPLNTVGDDALEARITAWVLGEASSFEAGELEKLCAADPALGLFERRLRVLHGLVAEDFKAGPAAEWKLAAARRAKITDLLGVAPEVEEKIAARRRKSRGPAVRGLILALAACLVFGIFSIWLISGVGSSAKPAMVKESARIVNYSAPAPDAAEESRFYRQERPSGAPVSKPDSSYAHLRANSPFTSKPPPAVHAELPGIRGRIIDQGEDLEVQRKQMAEMKLERLDRDAAAAGVASPAAADAVADAGRAEDSIATLKKKLSIGEARTEARRALQAEMTARIEPEGIAGPPPAPATPVPAPAAKPAGLDSDDLVFTDPDSDESNGRGFVGGGMVGGANGGLPAEAVPEITTRSNADFISTVEGVTVPGIPAATGATVTDIITAGNRSGDAAIARNNIDAVLNNPDRAAGTQEEGEGIAALTGTFSDETIAQVDEKLAERAKPAAPASRMTKAGAGTLGIDAIPAAPARPAEVEGKDDGLKAWTGSFHSRSVATDEKAMEELDGKGRIAGAVESEGTTRGPETGKLTGWLVAGEADEAGFGGGGGMPQELQAGTPFNINGVSESRFKANLRAASEVDLGRGDASNFGDLDAMGRLAGEAKPQQDLDYFDSKSASQVVGGGADLSDLALKQRESGVDAGNPGQGYGLTAPAGGVAATGGLKRDLSVDPFAEQAPAIPAPAATGDFDGFVNQGAPIQSEIADESQEARFRGVTETTAGVLKAKVLTKKVETVPGEPENDARAKILEEVDKAWELSVPPVDGPVVTDAARGNLRNDLTKAADGNYNSLAQKEMIRRQSAVATSDKLRDDARTAYAAGNYRDAVAKYKESLTVLPDASMVEDRRKFLEDSLGDASVALSDEYRKVGKYQEARQLAADTLAKDANNADAKRVLEYLDDPIRTSPALTYEHAQNVEEVRRKLYIAEGNHNLGKFEDAQKTYEEVLRIDPYNKVARRGIEQVAAAKADYYRAAYDQTRAELLVETDKAGNVAGSPFDGSRGFNASESVSPEFVIRTITELEKERRQWREQIETLEKSKDGALIQHASGLAIPDNVLPVLVPQLQDARRQLDAMRSSGLGPSHPSVAALSRNVESMDRDVKEAIENLKATLAVKLELAGEQVRLLASKLEPATRESVLARLVAPVVAKSVIVEPTAETVTTDEPFSTFSLHVSDASFKLAQAAMERGEVPAAEGIRPEEFYNAFDYGDPAPASGEPVVCVTEQSAHPAFAQRNLLRIGVRTGSQGRGASTPLNLTLLLDHSGSMEREDRNAGLAMAVRQLSGLLKEGDTITVAGFSRQPRLLADRLPGARAQELNELIARTPSEGGTNLEEGLKLGEELAKRQFNPAAQNRVVLFTDGAANLGDARPEALQARIERLRQQGIAFDAAGFGADGLNDKLLERLTRNGNGRYYIVDGPEDADAGFAKQLAGAFRPAAENVKVQVRFNPARVAKYKLIGFEEHRLKKEDFRNDAVDAAEMAAEEAGNALYQIETLPQGEGEVGEVSVRFHDVASGQMVERTWTIPYDAQAPAFDKATASIQLAGLAAFTAEKLRAAPMADAVDFQQLGQVYAGVRARYPNSQPVADLGSMIGKMK